eukprot:CAMPEP_0119007336 /NCGR_PEP_ID=MMETSP1176-20130426/2941_1 /TAXON_ID=265551 /ORGANISM="Synedropsis recta cf, Strain CCMP1620" /LENGTH=294 /DNA_ID=CAMNT_0006959459 /DNA_START=160 /DNA_END=1044 /DNA_ORIENTATION=+
MPPAPLSTISTVASSSISSSSSNEGGVQDFGSESRSKYAERSKRWIVLVDDEEQIRKAVGQYLFDSGYQVTACPDAKAALDVSRTRRRKSGSDSSPTATGSTAAETLQIPDLIVSDIRMPGDMDGIGLLTAIREDDRLVGVPVVLLTAKGMTQDRIAGFRAGADAYIPKPFDPDELLSVIDNAIGRHETLNNEEKVLVDDLQQDVEEIKYMLLQQGGAGVGNGWVEETNVFLAPDERRVLEFLCEGMYNQEIADEMELSRSRIESIITSMLRKTKLSNRTQLVRWAVSTGNVQI